MANNNKINNSSWNSKFLLKKIPHTHPSQLNIKFYYSINFVDLHQREAGSKVLGCILNQVQQHLIILNNISYLCCTCLSLQDRKKDRKETNNSQFKDITVNCPWLTGTPLYLTTALKQPSKSNLMRRTLFFLSQSGEITNFGSILALLPNW